MAVRKEGEPQIIPSAIPTVETLAPSQPVFVNLTDSSEANQVRSPLAVGDTAVVRCAFTSRELNINERKSLRNDGKLSDGLTVSPEVVACSVKSPSGEQTLPLVTVSEGVYEASFDVTSSGGWFYSFAGEGRYSGSHTSAIDVR